jgi:hypothetical protein
MNDRDEPNQERLSEHTKEQLRALGELGDAPAAVYGGLATDALLSGTVEREHGDIDVLVLQADAAEMSELLTAKGYDVTDLGRVTGGPNKLRALRGGVVIDVSVIDIDPETEQPCVDVNAPDGQQHRVLFDPDIFNYPPQRLEDEQVRTVSPLGMFHIRHAVALNGFEASPNVSNALNRLTEKYFPGTPPEQLAPVIRPLS